MLSPLEDSGSDSALFDCPFSCWHQLLSSTNCWLTMLLFPIMPWGIKCFIDWSNPAQGFKQDETLRSVAEICSGPRALSSCPFHQVSHQTGWPTDYLPVQWVHHSPTFCLSSQTALFSDSTLRLELFHTVLQMKSVLLGETQSSRHNLTGMALVLGQRQLLSEWHTHLRRRVWKEGQLHQFLSACFSWHATSTLQQERLALLYSQECRTQMYCNYPMSGGWAEEWSPYFLVILA